MKPARLLFVVYCLLAALVLVRMASRPPLLLGNPNPRLVLSDSEPEPTPAPPAPAGVRKKNSPTRGQPAANRPTVSHQPQQPRSGQPVVIEIDFHGEVPAANTFRLEYQVVDPGKYIALNDAAFARGWETSPMSPQGDRPASQDAHHILRAQLPGELQKHRRLVRYRIRSVVDQKLLAPDANDAQPNYAYFVYDGVPPWKGAINPGAGQAKLRSPVTYSSETLQKVPVYHFISSRRAVENVTWTPREMFGGDRNAYRYTGTMVYDGVVYDHVGFRARGGVWRHAMGKNMWKFNFLPGHRFEARDQYGRRYETKWDKLNLGACIQQANFGMRGEQGMFEAVGFRLFNLAGQEAPRAHFVHLRIINQAEESPQDQYAGDFWGLYLAVENVDERFLKEHDLPPGNLYKMEGRAKTEFNGDPTVTDQSDVREFMSNIARRQVSGEWWAETIDLPRYYNYRSILECIHHYDVDGSKNYFYYRNPKSQKWIVLPWDIDLTWGEHMWGSGREPFYRSGVLSKSPCKQQYQERLAEIRDLLFNPDQTGRLIDEYAALVWDPAGRPSLVDADRAKWDYNPILASRYVVGMKAGLGRFYLGDPHNTFLTMVNLMKSYVARRCAWIDSKLLGDYRPSPPPQIRKPVALDLTNPTVSLQLENGPSDGSHPCRWRLAEVTDSSSPGFKPNRPWNYEIEPIWQIELAKASEPAIIPTNLLQPGHTYRFRAKWQDTDGTWSRWSAPMEWAVPVP